MKSNHGSRRFTLRQQTSAAHESLDQHIGLFSSPGDYSAYLVGMANFRSCVEPQLRDLPASLDGWQPSLIGAALTEDMADLGIAVPIAALPARLSLEGSGAFGTLYVLEGSALGARLLYRRAQELGFTATFGARHLAQQSASLDAWSGLLLRLEDAQPFEIDEAIAAANATFAVARQAFEARTRAAAA